jgi:hypothetical protein
MCQWYAVMKHLLVWKKCFNYFSCAALSQYICVCSVVSVPCVGLMSCPQWSVYRICVSTSFVSWLNTHFWGIAFDAGFSYFVKSLSANNLSFHLHHSWSLICFVSCHKNSIHFYFVQLMLDKKSMRLRKKWKFFVNTSFIILPTLSVLMFCTAGLGVLRPRRLSYHAAAV